MYLPDVPEIYLGDTGVTRMYLGTDEVWPCPNGLCPERMITYRWVDSGGTPLAVQDPLDYNYWFDEYGRGDYYPWSRWFKTTEGYEEPIYDDNGIMIWDNPLLEVQGTFTQYVNSQSYPGPYLEVNFPDTIESLHCAFFECTPLKNCNIPANCRDLTATFQHCHFLESASVPEGLTELLNDPFFACTRLSYLHLPSTLSYVGSPVIAQCYALEEIDFGGTMAQFMAIDGVEYFNPPFVVRELKRIVCTDGIITVPFGYTQYDYIAPTGTTYGNNLIFVNKQCTTGFSVNAEFRLLAYVGGSFLGFTSTSDQDDYRLIYPSNRQLHFDFGAQRISRTYSVADDLIGQDLNWRIRNYNIEDLSTPAPYEYVLTGTTQTYAPNLVQYRINVGSARIYRIEMYDIVDRQRTLQVDLIPVTRNSDGTPGLYDRIGGGFYTAQDPTAIGAFNIE